MRNDSGLYAKGYEPIAMGDEVIIPPFHREVTVCDELGTLY